MAAAPYWICERNGVELGRKPNRPAAMNVIDRDPTFKHRPGATRVYHLKTGECWRRTDRGWFETERVATPAMRGAA
ncbi:MAG TPA: hypothetical protein VEC14_02755 [Reyranellaceae bacterium]|nr:hypothetical protein [Reyranellaceae bacterium]